MPKNVCPLHPEEDIPFGGCCLDCLENLQLFNVRNPSSAPPKPIKIHCGVHDKWFPREGECPDCENLNVPLSMRGPYVHGLMESDPNGRGMTPTHYSPVEGADWIEWPHGPLPEGLPTPMLGKKPFPHFVVLSLDDWDVTFHSLKFGSGMIWDTVNGWRMPNEGESDPNGVDQHEPGAKLDAGKVQGGVLEQFSKALLAVAEVGTHGAEKYSRGGWQTVENGIERYGDAKWRHLLKGSYEDLDPDSKLKHKAHEAWNILAELELILREEGK